MTPPTRKLRATLCPRTSTLMEAPLVRLALNPSPRNRLCKPSRLMADKLFTMPMAALDLALRGWLELP
ncbi:MAG: hypothetical protein ACK6AD_02245 [Cyanobacteriota bacterium]|jgi:mRNA interferase MazF